MVYHKAAGNPVSCAPCAGSARNGNALRMQRRLLLAVRIVRKNFEAARADPGATLFGTEYVIRRTENGGEPMSFQEQARQAMRNGGSDDMRRRELLSAVEWNCSRLKAAILN